MDKFTVEDVKMIRSLIEIAWRTGYVRSEKEAMEMFALRDKCKKYVIKLEQLRADGGIADPDAMRTRA